MNRKQLAELLLDEYANGLTGPIVWAYLGKEDIESPGEKISDQEWADFVSQVEDHSESEFTKDVNGAWLERASWMDERGT